MEADSVDTTELAATLLLPSNPQVVMTIALGEDQDLNTEDWIQWYRRIPAKITAVKFQGMFKSNSTLLLASVGKLTDLMKLRMELPEECGLEYT